MKVATLGSSLRLAVGTLTAIPVPAVRRVSPAVARGAMLCAPLAAVPLAVVVAAVVLLADRVGLAAGPTGFVAIGVLAMGSRALHLDGLSDVADGLTGSYDRERSLQIMKGGTAGPAGAAALVIVLGTQATALATLLAHTAGAVAAAGLAAAAVIGSRAALWLSAARPVPPARTGGLGVSFSQTVPVWFAGLGWLGLAALAAVVDPVRGPVTVVLAAVAVIALLRRAVHRFGGVTGDVFGASIEIALMVLLLGAATLA